MVATAGAGRSLGYLLVMLVGWIIIIQLAFAVMQGGPAKMLLGGPQPTSKQADLTVVHANDAEEKAIRQAVAQLRYQPPRAGLTFSVMKDPASSAQGEYVPGVNVIQIRETVVHNGGIMLQRALAHEIGHYVDQTHFNDDQRTEYLRWRGIPTNTDWLSWNRPWQNRPVEDFAEVFSVMDCPEPMVGPETRYGPVENTGPFVKQLESVGVRFDHRVPSYNWQAGMRQEASFAKYVLANPLTRIGLIVLAIFYLLLGAIPGWKRGWG
jgi:hypothetical protein